MSRSRHPIAATLESKVGDGDRLLAVVMGLPLVDGIFAALVLAGALESVGGILQVGLIVFGGSATVAVVLVEMEGNRWRRIRSVLWIGTGLVAGAALVAALAPTIGAVIQLAIFERFAGLVLLAVAAKTASARIGEYLPRPAVIVGLGLVASFEPMGADLVVSIQPDLMLRAIAAAGVAVVFALTVAGMSPIIHDIVDIDRFRFGSAVALGMLPLGLLELIPGNTALAVFVVSGLLAFDPSGVDYGPESEQGAEETSDQATPAGPPYDDESGVTERAPWL